MDPDVDNFKVKRSISVKESNADSIYNLNELEFAYGYIFSNIWMSNKMIIINPEDGTVFK